MLEMLGNAVLCGVSLLLAAWTAGALYFDVGRGSRWGGLLAGGWLTLVGVGLVCWSPLWQPVVALLACCCLFLVWWLSQEPSNDRPWAPGFTQVPSAEIAGDTITLHNVRNTEYRTLDDCTVRYETRTYRLSHLTGVDALLLTWGSPWMSHPMFVFDFGADGRVCVSVEVRYRVGQPFSFFRSLYRQQELMYVVSDERDAILRRTRCLEGHDLYLYRLHPTPLTLRDFLFEDLTTINGLAAAPRWYHGLTNNCTTSLYLQGQQRMVWDWRMLFNGSLDRLMWDRGLLDPSQPFETLKAQSWINEIANRAPAEGFGDYLRRELPGYR